MIYLVAYDISNPKRLKKFAAYCERFGIRLQKSVFQLDCSKEIIEKFVTGFPSIINKKVDSIVLYPLCEDCRRLSRLQGPNDLINPEEVIIL
ncbi:MAG: CRISPR-associated endonuclease Cas2 [Rectinema subterraneum]|jgi:CRISPR-associated protein Cas2